MHLDYKFLQYKEMHTYAVPEHTELSSDLPRNPNGKIDVAQIFTQYKEYFSEPKS